MNDVIFNKKTWLNKTN